jgi:hypothetical protein
MNRTREILRSLASVVIAAAALFGLAAPAAHAEVGIASFTGSNSIEGQFSRQAGAHSDLDTDIQLTQVPYGPFGSLIPSGDPRDVRVELPPGMIGNPTAVPTCTPTQLIAGENGKLPLCPAETQIGIARVNRGAGGIGEFPVFNMERPAELPALFALNFAGVVIYFEPTVRSSDYGVTTVIPSISQGESIYGLGLELWAVPAAHSHDAERTDPNKFGPEFPGKGVTSKAPQLPFLTNPTSCPATATQTRGEVDSWQDPGVFVHAQFESDTDGNPFVWGGCGRVPFHPSATVLSGTHRAASPTGLEFEIRNAQVQDPNGIASAAVKKVVTTFPLGVTVSPSAVAGLGACAPAQIKVGSDAPATCPDSSKIGNVTIETPLLEESLEGEVILASQKDNPFGSTFAVYLVVKGPGVYLKLPGELNLDQQTGQLKTVFDDLPQLPFDEVSLDFRGGPTAPFVTPNTCGTYSTHTEITSWASPIPVVIDAPMLIDENCAGGGGFSPTLQAGVANPVAGAQSPLTIRVRRQDGEQNLSRLEFTLPEGELASLKGVGLCPEAQTASGACPVSSQVGIATTAIGTGAFPLFVPQPGKEPTALYLAGPYKGAPYSLITKVPAQTGPFDFGNIVVRTAINVNPNTTQVIAKSDPLPQILEGVPISYRDVRIEVEKPDFTVNPTSCEQRAVTSTISSIAGGQAHPSVPFKVGDCASLKFKPKLALRLKGGTHRGDFPALTATLTTGRKEANLSRAVVRLPHSEFLEQGHIGTVCTRVQYAAKACPAASIYGYAKAYTPLLDRPLEGPVYLRSSNHTLPDLVAELNGQFDVELAGRIDSKNGGIRNTFETVPDAPVSKFVLRLKAGKKSLLVNSRNLCKKPARANIQMVGQNGMHFAQSPALQTACHGGKAKPKPKGGGS